MGKRITINNVTDQGQTPMSEDFSTKAITALLNAYNAGRLYASGIIKLAGAAGLVETGVGAPVGLGAAVLGTWNIYSATAAQCRAVQLWSESLQEDWSDASWRNFLGVLPYGQYYDDPFERTPIEFLQEKRGKIWDLILELIKELGTLSW
jgi:hypothetical protein